MARIWDLSSDTACYEILVGQPSGFRHRLGGEPSHAGITPARGKAPIHLVMTLDLSDDRVPFTQPGVSELPIFFPFQYDGSSVSYRILDDRNVEIVEQPSRDFTSGFPFQGYPRCFPPQPISLCDRVGIDAYLQDEFLKEQWKNEQKLAAKSSRTLDDVDRIALVEGLMQGPPRSTCPTAECHRQPLRLLTALRGDLIPGFHFWAADEYGPEVDITYEYCPSCFLIHTENQCG